MSVLMEVLGDIGTLISLGQEVEAIFGGPTPPLSDIQAELETEVAAVFFGAQLQQEVLDAAAQLQTVQKFFAINYLNAQINHESAAQLSTLLNSSESPGLSNLATVAETVDGWLALAGDQPAPKDLISTAMSVCLGVYLHMCLLYRERASNEDAANAAATETDDKRSYARLAVQKMQPQVMNRIANRIAIPGYSEGIWNPPSGDPTYAYAVPLNQAAISDSWFDGGSNGLLSSLPLQYPDGWNPSTVVQRVLHAYRRLLWSGADADYNELLAALNDRGMGTIIGYRVTNVDHSMRDAFIANSLPGVRAFGKWAASARALVMSLDAMGMASPGLPQDDWHRCSQCGGLYFDAGFPDDGTKRCPKSGGQHASADGGDYVMHVIPSTTEPATAPVGWQGDWCYCASCLLLFFRGSSPSVCPAGGPHNPASSGYYFLAVGDVPVQIGISIEQGWLFCNACSALHSYKNGVSVCPGKSGGPHSSDGSGNYWLSSLGSAA